MEWGPEGLPPAFEQHLGTVLAEAAPAAPLRAQKTPEGWRLGAQEPLWSRETGLSGGPPWNPWGQEFFPGAPGLHWHQEGPRRTWLLWDHTRCDGVAAASLLGLALSRLAGDGPVAFDPRKPGPDDWRSPSLQALGLKPLVLPRAPRPAEPLSGLKVRWSAGPASAGLLRDLCGQALEGLAPLGPGAVQVSVAADLRRHRPDLGLGSLAPGPWVGRFEGLWQGEALEPWWEALLKTDPCAVYAGLSAPRPRLEPQWKASHLGRLERCGWPEPLRLRALHQVWFFTPLQRGWSQRPGAGVCGCVWGQTSFQVTLGFEKAGEEQG